MKNAILFYVMSVLTIVQPLFAKTVCTMTFNSSNEKEVFKKHLLPLGYQFNELVPTNKNPYWLEDQCKAAVQCDILLISGHFGGIFFGEQLSSTLSLKEIEKHKDDPRCEGIFKKPKSVFLMGCNTLSSKTPDHRSVSDYLRVLVGDGFPIDLAEEVAASRYLNFGLSMADQMKSHFNDSTHLIGFESTGPLGKQAEPLIERAFQKTSKLEKMESGISLNALKESFKGTNLRVVAPVKNNFDDLKRMALSTNKEMSSKAWMTIIKRDSIHLFYDFLIENIKHPNLSSLLALNNSLYLDVKSFFISIIKESQGLTNVQLKSIYALKEMKAINQWEFEVTLVKLIEQLINQDIDYVTADQLCKVLRKNTDLKLLGKVKISNSFQRSLYYNYMKKCNGEKLPTQMTQSLLCLNEKKDHDWGCLTSYANDLSIEACQLAKSRNTDPENADDMMWFCYSKMREYRQLNPALCLELTHQFSLLGNQIKMNWNCNNQLNF